jgi:hypothetical protein
VDTGAVVGEEVAAGEAGEAVRNRRALP